MNQKLSSKAPNCDPFARWAPHYENGEVFCQLLLDLRMRSADWLRLAPHDRFLEVGCATGAAVRDAATMVELAMGVDVSSAMVEQAQVFARGRPRALFVVADARRLPFPAGTFSASCARPRFAISPMQVVRVLRWCECWHRRAG